MPDDSLEGLHILVVEDEYLLASDISDALTDSGARVVGPAPSVSAAETLAAGEPRLDAALLDINLGGTMVFDFADALRARAVPFVFATGYDNSAIPDRFSTVPRLEKPVDTSRVLAALKPLLSQA